MPTASKLANLEYGIRKSRNHKTKTNNESVLKLNTSLNQVGLSRKAGDNFENCYNFHAQNKVITVNVL